MEMSGLRALAFCALCLLPSIATSPALARSPEAALTSAAQRAYREAKRPIPAADPRLNEAARLLARRALEGTAREVTAQHAVTAAMSAAGAWDPAPRIIVLKVSPADRAPEAMARREDLASVPATHLGAAIATRGDEAAAVLLLTERRGTIDLFPRRVEPGSSHVLEGSLAFPLYDARVFVTSPEGEAKPIEPFRAARNRFRAKVPFPHAGWWTVEVVAQSAKGPEVVALFRVAAGNVDDAAPTSQVTPERYDLPKAESQVLQAINARRKKHGRRPLSRSALLDSVASAHAREMARLGFFGHVSPTTGDVAQRVRAAGFAYARVTENLGEAATPLEAHQAIVASPGHLANVLDEKVEMVGLGTARVRRGSIENVLLVEVYARPMGGRGTGPADVELAKLLNEARQRGRLTALSRDATLDGLALAHARAMLQIGAPTGSIDGISLTERVLEHPGYASAAADIFIASQPEAALRSKNLLRPQFDRLGVAALTGPKAANGARQLWIVVIYARSGR